jgi:hypothetical protein
MDRHRDGAVTSPSKHAVTYGDYFQAIGSFLQSDRFKMTAQAVSYHSAAQVPPRDIEKIHICQEKHGQFYHPACVQVTAGGVETRLVLNGAVSPAGQGALQRECRLLQQLEGPYVPKVHGMGVGRTGSGVDLPMFLGEWLDGYCEFHLSKNSPEKDGKYRIVVWNTEKENVFLNDGLTKALYRQAARILAHYYCLSTFEQIYPWHHAAGDFVVYCRADTLTVKLISIRQYAAMADAEGARIRPDLILEALLLFLLNLTIRMRIDRLEGVGDPAWAGDPAVEASVDGFFAALAQKSPPPGLPDAVHRCFKAYLVELSPQALYDRARDIAATYDPKAPDTAMVLDHLKDHVAEFYWVVHAR